MSSGKKESTTTSVSQAPEWAMPYYKGGIEQAQNLANKPYEMYQGPRVAGAGEMNPFASNEYSDAMVQQNGQDITSQYMTATQPSMMAQFNAGGAFGGSAHQQALQGSQDALAHHLANSANDIRYRQADAARGEWTNANTRLQSLYDSYKGDYDTSQNWDAQRFGLLTNALNTIQGGSQTQTGANPNYRSAGQNVGTAAAILGSMYGGGG